MKRKVRSTAILSLMSLSITPLCLMLLCFFTLTALTKNDNCVITAYASTKAGTAKEKQIYIYQLNEKRLNDFQAVTSSLGDTDMKIKASKDEHFYLSYYIHCYNSKNPVSYQIRDNTLHLDAKNVDSALYTYKKGNYTVSKNKTKITLYVPEKQLTKITLQADDADLSLRNISCQNISIRGTYGFLHISSIKKLRKMQLQSQDGDITLSDMDTDGTIQVKTNSGYVKASNIHSLGAIKISTNDGDVRLADFYADGSLQVESDDGYITAKTLTLPGNAKMTTKDGDIMLTDFHITGNTRLNSVYGYISLKTDKKYLNNLGITLKTNDGKMSIVQSLDGQKKRYKEYGWRYIKNGTAEGSQLTAFTKEGDISLK